MTIQFIHKYDDNSIYSYRWYFYKILGLLKFMNKDYDPLII